MEIPMADFQNAFLSGFLSMLWDRTGSSQVVDFFRGNHLDVALLEELKALLLSVATVLSDAEEKQFTSPSVKEWVDRIKNAAYDADDLLDDIATKEALQDNMDSQFHATLGHFKDYASSLNPFAERVKSKIENMIESLKSIIEHKALLGLKEGSVAKSLPLATATTPLIDERRVYGRNCDKEKVIDFLLSGNSHGEEGVPLVAVVGMGGIGKTTLAQILYNDVRVRNHFQLRSWTSVSETLDVYGITKKVFESFTLSYSDITDLNVLQIKLQKRLSSQRFLLVLDGFCNENFLDWDILQRPFLPASCGSRIIVTTRSQNVAMTIGADLIHSLSPLSEEDISRLFLSYASKSGNLDDNSVLAKIVSKIVRKCNGLPITAKTLGSILRAKEDAEEWENISNSKTWGLPSDNSSKLPTLILSYTDLPSHLKRCFTYCSIFPKGFEIEKWNLIYLWMAQGILPRSETQKRMEDVGDECFQELLSRSLLRQSTHHKFMMHDHVHDLAQCVAGDFFYKLEDDNPSKITTRVRHLSYLQGIYDNRERLASFSNLDRLRTFLPFKFSPVVDLSIDEAVLTLLENLKRLRVFSLSYYPVAKLPDSIGKLVHLRYLNLAYTDIECLPDSLCTLYNLETLLLSCCIYLSKLPAKMFKLVNLRHLDISQSKIEEMPTYFGSLKSLQVLTSFIVSRDGGSKISELGQLLQLRGTLLIENLQNVVNAREAFDARLKGKKYLHELEFRWTSTTHDVESETKVLDMLEPHENVRRLKIQSFGGDKLPDWLGSSWLSSMVLLHIADCGNCLSLPSLGQLPSLKELYITNMTSLQKLGPEFYGNEIKPFRHLEIVKFVELPNWEEWSTGELQQSEVFLLLQELHIQRCPKLTKKLPNHLPSLEKLVITACQALRDPMPQVPKLRELELTDCDALVSLSEQMMQENTS